MKKVTLLLLISSLLPSCVQAWNKPGDDFSGELRLEGEVTSTRNPWVWKSGEGNEALNIRQTKSPGNGRGIPVPLPAVNILLGKTMLTTPTGREGLAPRVFYGRGVTAFSLVWTEPGVAEVTLPVTGGQDRQAGTFVFRMQVAGVLRHVQSGRAIYTGLYNDLQANGFPDEQKVMADGLVPGVLQDMFCGDAPSWLQGMTVTGKAGLSQFSDTSLSRLDGVYGARVVANSGELRLSEDVPEQWHVSLPVSIEYP